MLYRRKKVFFNRKIKIAVLCCLSFFLSLHAFSDQIYLKNGRKIEGIIEKEEDSSIILNIGFGTIKLNREEIDYVARDNLQERDFLKQKWRDKYFTRLEFVPDRLKDIIYNFRYLKQSRSNALRSKQINDNLLKKINKQEKEIKKLDSEIKSMNKTLGSISPKDDVLEYNSLVEDYNYLITQVRFKKDQCDVLKEQSANLHKNISKYMDDLSFFKRKVKDEVFFLEGGITIEEKLFIARIKREIEEMDEDFRKYAVDSRKFGSHVIVAALLNNYLKVSLLVDTGASLVLISKVIAHRLGISIEDKDSFIYVTLADGKKTEAYPVVLKTVKVGQVQVQNVKAAVLIEGKSMSADGLLGMSFLENFIVRIDGKNNKLILEEFDL